MEIDAVPRGKVCLTLEHPWLMLDRPWSMLDRQWSSSIAEDFHQVFCAMLYLCDGHFHTLLWVEDRQRGSSESLS
jgi:hypothetical protein